MRKNADCETQLKRKDFGFMISHEYKCIFVHLPSTASKWIELGTNIKEKPIVYFKVEKWKLQDSKPRRQDDG